MQASNVCTILAGCYKTIGRKCFSNAYGSRNFHDAENICKAWGGTLPSFQNAEEQEVGRKIWGKHAYWIGMKRVAQTNGDNAHDWKFLDGSPNGYAMSTWMPGSPSDHKSHMGCAARYDSNSQSLLKDVHCYSALPFFCTFIIPVGAKII